MIFTRGWRSLRGITACHVFPVAELKIRCHDSPARRSQNALHVTSHDDVRGLGDGDVVFSCSTLLESFARDVT